MDKDKLIHCKTLNGGLTITESQAAVFLAFGEEEDEPTHILVMEQEMFDNFMGTLFQMGAQMHQINEELEGLDPEERNLKLIEMRQRYSAPSN